MHIVYLGSIKLELICSDSSPLRFSKNQLLNGTIHEDAATNRYKQIEPVK